MLRIETAKVFESLIQPARLERGEERRPKPTIKKPRLGENRG
jgi:hypothetical protein